MKIMRLEFVPYGVAVLAQAAARAADGALSAANSSRASVKASNQ